MAFRQDLFVFALQQLCGGRTQEELSKELNQLVLDCRSTGKAGELTLKINVRPDKGDNGQYFLKPEIKTKTPKFEVSESLFWATPDGNLQRQDPSQGELELRSVSTTQAAARFVDEPAVNAIKL